MSPKVLSIDGFLYFPSSAWDFGIDEKIKIDERVYYSHSLGIFYKALTQWLGFPKYGDENKVMGLAPYGSPRYLDKIKLIIIMKENG